MSSEKIAALQSIIWSVPTAMLVCADDVRILLANPAAESLLALHDGVFTLDNRLKCTTSADNAALARLIADVATPRPASTLRLSRSLRIPRPSGERAFVAIVASLPARDLGSGDGLESGALVVIHRHEAALGAAAAALRSCFDLTAAEIRLVDAMLDGAPLSEIAKRLGVTHETVRTQLRSVFSKTGTHRQGEMLQLVLSFRHAV